MASKFLKGLTIQIGADTSDLNKALDSVDKKSRSLSGELGQINKLLKFDPSNTTLLAQKQKVLADAISNTEERLDTLREAEKQVQAQFERGEVSEQQYRALQREIIDTEKKLDSYKKAAKETAEAAEKLGKESEDAADGIKKTAKEAEDADDAVSELGAGLASAAATGFSALAAAATAAVGAILATAEASREYRREMGKLDTAFKDANFSSEAAYETYSALQGVLGETDQAVEAVNHLAKLCDTEEDLAAWTDILTGVYATFGASLQPEALSEAANETARCGTVTGAFADSLNWAAEEGETFGVTMREATEENEEWNKAVEEATTAEDYFNLALQECNSEQERQQLITKTLTKLYKNAATQYKKTNKEVIRANEATEEWNKTVAEIGEEMEPVVTDIKEMGVALLKNAKEPLKKVADFVRTKLIPALTSISSWVSQHMPQITTTALSFIATMGLYKAAVLSSEMATKGLTIATIAQQAAQKALNLIMNANPFVLVMTAISGLTTAMLALNLAFGESPEKVDVLTEAERELMAAADEAAAAFRDQQKATKDALGGIAAEMGHVQNLATELQGLADASGRVQEKDQARVDFILGQLNEALGTEYALVDGVIQQYDSLKSSIDEVIQSKLANSLLEAANADYVTAIQNEADALKNLVLKEKDYQAQIPIVQEAEEAYLGWKKAYDQAIADGDFKAAQAAQANLTTKEINLNREKEILDEKKAAYGQAAENYGNYHNTILDYEEAQTAALEGNYQKAADLLVEKGQAFGQYSDEVDSETAKVVDTLFKEAVDAGVAAQRTKKNFENGVDGYTEDMVKEAEQSYEDALDAYADAYADAESVGEDLGSGLAGGMENQRSSLVSKARSLVSGIISAMRKEADSNSPAQKTIDFGEDVGEGAEIGIDNKTDDVARAARRQAAAMLDEYNSQEVTGQNALRSIAEQRASTVAANQLATATANSATLDKILAAIKAGQILTIDGNTLVGATAGRMDNALGQRRILVERGAM